MIIEEDDDPINEAYESSEFDAAQPSFMSPDELEHLNKATLNNVLANFPSDVNEAELYKSSNPIFKKYWKMMNLLIKKQIIQKQVKAQTLAEKKNCHKQIATRDDIENRHLVVSFCDMQINPQHSCCDVAIVAVVQNFFDAVKTYIDSTLKLGIHATGGVFAPIQGKYPLSEGRGFTISNEHWKKVSDSSFSLTSRDCDEITFSPVTGRLKSIKLCDGHKIDFTDRGRISTVWGAFDKEFRQDFLDFYDDGGLKEGFINGYRYSRLNTSKSEQLYLAEDVDKPGRKLYRADRTLKYHIDEKGNKKFYKKDGRTIDFQIIDDKFYDNDMNEIVLASKRRDLSKRILGGFFVDFPIPSFARKIEHFADKSIRSKISKNR